MNEIIKVSLWWIDQGFEIAPVQPGTKKYYPGYGPHLRTLKNIDQVAGWFGFSSNQNIVAVAKPDHFILDFDDQALYTYWKTHTLESLVNTYSEQTPRGGHHAFYRGEPPKGLKLKKGIELKSSVLVYPSKVEGRAYTRGAGDIVDGDIINIFQWLSEPGTPTANLLRTIDGQKTKPAPRDSNLITQIKARYPITKILDEFHVEFIRGLAGRGHTVATRCPFHKGGHESNPSFWIDFDSNTWGCHTCHISGDVINLFAQLRGISNTEAIKELARRIA